LTADVKEMRHGRKAAVFRVSRDLAQLLPPR
jgi:hypothetical protein